MIERTNRALESLARIKYPWWMWPSLMVFMAVFANLAAWTLQPLGAEWVALPDGTQFGDTCGMILTTGLPCPNCGMTRSWVHGIRGDLVAAFYYNPAGLALFGWVNAGGVLGAIRLIRWDPNAAKLHELLFFGWLMIWLIPLYLGGYLLRIAGFMPLP